MENNNNNIINDDIDDIILWEIDRNPDYNILLNFINDDRLCIPNPDIKIEEIIITEEDKLCCICLDSREKNEICQINCGHKYCKECILKHIKNNKYCPLCRSIITKISIQEIHD